LDLATWVAGFPRQKKENNMAQSPKRKEGAHTGVLTEFTLFVRIKPGEEQAARDTVSQFTSNAQMAARRQDAVQQIGTLHEGRFVLFDNDTRLMFCSSFDGTWDKYIDDFATTYISHMFDVVFSHAEGWPGLEDTDVVKDWFQAQSEEAATYFSAYPNGTVKQIWKALALQRAFQEVLDNPQAERALQDPALKPLLEQAST
jgi:hypothetical protein